MSIRGAHSAAPITVDMGYGNEVTVELTSGIKTFSLLSGTSQEPSHTVANGGTITLERQSWDYSYQIYANLNQYVSNDWNQSVTGSFINSGATTLVNGSKLTINRDTPKGTYLISVDPNQYKDPASFTLIIK
jgi:hypothetical protein